MKLTIEGQFTPGKSTVNDPITQNLEQALSRWLELTKNPEAEAEVLTCQVALALEKAPTFKGLADGWIGTRPMPNMLSSLCAEVFLAGVVAQTIGIAPIIPG